MKEEMYTLQSLEIGDTPSHEGHVESPGLVQKAKEEEGRP
jgi:hypothetical protein